MGRAVGPARSAEDVALTSTTLSLAYLALTASWGTQGATLGDPLCGARVVLFRGGLHGNRCTPADRLQPRGGQDAPRAVKSLFTSTDADGGCHRNAGDARARGDGPRSRADRGLGSVTRMTTLSCAARAGASGCGTARPEMASAVRSTRSVSASRARPCSAPTVTRRRRVAWWRLEYSSSEDYGRYREVDHDPGDVDECRHERGRGAGRVEPKTFQCEGKHRAGE
jgi:hypothetical protein